MYGEVTTINRYTLTMTYPLHFKHYRLVLLRVLLLRESVFSLLCTCRGDRSFGDSSALYYVGATNWVAIIDFPHLAHVGISPMYTPERGALAYPPAIIAQRGAKSSTVHHLSFSPAPCPL